MRRTPMPRDGFPPGHKSNWPDVVRNMEDLFAAIVGMSEEERKQFWDYENAVRMRPSAKQIQRMEEALPWFFAVGDARKRKVAFARSLIHPVSGRHIVSYSKLGSLHGLHKDTMRCWHNDALDEIGRHLRTQKKSSSNSSESSIFHAIL